MNPNALYAYQYYLKRGYNPNAAAGIAGNFMVESGFAPDVITGQRRGDQGTAFGAGQWRGERLANLKSYAESQGMDYRTLDAQLGFADHEMRNGLDAGAATAYAKLQNAQNPAEAAQAFMRHYERPAADPAINHIAKRMDYANTLAGGPTTGAVATGLPALASQGAATANSVASALPTVGATTPMVNPTTAAATAETATAASDPMGGVFGLLLQARMNQPTPVPVAAPVQRKAPDTRSEEEKLASVSQTPDFYIERMRRHGRSVV